MDYKQKYEEALERAKRYQGMVVLPAESMIETIFHELAESKDEKTRKEIVGYLKKNLRLEWVTWLEKQWQNPAWTEADDEEFEIAINALKGAGQYDSAVWLVTIKQRIGG